MNPRNIESTLSKIVEIDMDAIKLEEKTQNLAYENEKGLRKRLREVEFEHMKKARKEGNRKYTDTIQRAEVEEQNIIVAGEKECLELDTLMQEKKDYLAKHIFQKLLALKEDIR